MKVDGSQLANPQKISRSQGETCCAGDDKGRAMVESVSLPSDILRDCEIAWDGPDIWEEAEVILLLVTALAVPKMASLTVTSGSSDSDAILVATVYSVRMILHWEAAEIH
jgi:hypothetical protein